MDARAPAIGVIVLAGGAGTRLGLADGANKVYLPLGGRPLLAWSLQALYAAFPAVSAVVVVRAGDEADARAAVAAAAVVPGPIIVTGGTTRTGSELAGVAALREQFDHGALDVVLIHDGARPFPGIEMLHRLVTAADAHGAAIPALAVSEDIIRVTDGLVAPVDTGAVRSVQTPQAVSAPILLAAMETARQTGVEAADTAELVARCGGPAAVVVEGDPNNLKVTHPADVARAESIAAFAYAGRGSQGPTGPGDAAP